MSSQTEASQPKADLLKADLATRLRRIEGQVRGVQRMIEEERTCPEILQQMTAIRAAVRQASLVLARAYLTRCLTEGTADDMDAALDRMVAVLGKVEVE